MSPDRVVLAIILASAAVRLALAGTTGLGFDESYMAANARWFSWSYVDHPPLHIWLTGLAGWLTGSEHPLVLRLPFILLFAGTTWLMFRLTTLLFDAPWAGVWAAIVLNLAPVFTLATGTWILPDGPLYFFLTLAAWLLARLNFGDEPEARRPGLWLALGAAVGFGLLSKYHMGFFVLGAFLFLLTTPQGRTALATPWPWLAALLAGLIFLPVVLWNAARDWVGLSFQTRRVGDATTLNPTWFFELLGGQAGYLLPWIFLPLAALLIAALVRGPRDRARWMLALLALGPILVMNAASLTARGLPHWPMPGWLLAVPLLGAALAVWPRRGRGHLRRTAWGHALVLPLLFGALAWQSQTGWLSRAAPTLLHPVDPTVDLLDWRALRPALEARGDWPDDPVLASASWMYAGKLSYALGREVPVLCLCANPQHFAFRPETEGLAGATVLAVLPRQEVDRLGGTLPAFFDSFEEIAPVVLNRGGAPALTLHVYRGSGLVADYHAGR